MIRGINFHCKLPYLPRGLGQAFCNGGCEGGFAVIDVADRADVDVGLGSDKSLLLRRSGVASPLLRRGVDETLRQRGLDAWMPNGRGRHDSFNRPRGKLIINAKLSRQHT